MNDYEYERMKLKRCNREGKIEQVQYSCTDSKNKVRGK